ncbi:MAG TPA: peptide ABC transporter substrate-binding protein [Chromatiaceae bacterium]|nr:peptide ABC transporter substrate-binding protein [Chromatiaceae bacterium]
MLSRPWLIFAAACRVVFVSLLVSLSLQALAKPDPAQLASEQILHRGNGAEVQTLDPHKAEGVPSSNILRDLYEGLTIEAPDGRVTPGTAESWQVSDDGRVYTFHLRKNARWSNGDPLTAEDFVYSLRRSVDPATGSRYSQILAPILNAEAVIAGSKPPEALAVEALDEHTLKITLKAPTPYFLGLLNHSSTYPVHRASIEKHGDRFSRPGKLISNGAYRLSEWVVQSHIRLDRNPYYWDNEETLIESVYFYPIEDQSTELKRYRAGELDITEAIPLQQFRWIKKHLASELRVSPYLGTYYFGYNLTRAPFKDSLKLRRALSMAINREILTEKITSMGEKPLYSWVPEGILGYNPARLDYADWPHSKRIAEARRLYAEAGYTRDNPLTVEIRYNTSENHKKVAIAIAAMWKQALGVRVKLVNEEWKVFLENRKQKRLTQAFRAGWIGDYNDPYTFMEILHSRHGLNDSAYRNPEYDRLLEQAATESDPQERFALMQRAEALALSDHPVIPLYGYVSKHLVKPWVGNFTPNILDHHYTKHLYILKH